MLDRKGMTLMEIIVVMIMIGVAAVFCMPNFTTPTERARAANAQNNLLAIYSAQQNYLNNNNTTAYCVSTTVVTVPPCDTLADINTALSLNIQDDGTYGYSCAPTLTGVPQCTASRANSNSKLVITATLNAPIALPIGVNQNPTCGSITGNTNWCP